MRKMKLWVLALSLFLFASPAIAKIIHVPGDSAWQLRRNAAEALGHIETTEAIPSLEQLTTDPDPWVRLVARESRVLIKETSD